MPSFPLLPNLDPEFESALDVSGRRSFTALATTYFAIGLIYTLGFVFSRSGAEWSDGGWRLWVSLTGLLGALGIAAFFRLYYPPRLISRVQVMSAASTLIIMLGTMVLLARMIYADNKLWGLVDLFAIHVVASVLMPWTVRETLQPMIPLLLVWAMSVLLPAESPLPILDRVVACIVGPLILVPGGLAAFLQMRRQEDRIERIRLGRQVKTIGGELSRARIVHDAMFPETRETGHITFDYIYNPIAEIGGDYVHFHICPGSGKTTMTLLDVAGHGLAAALTVNRLFGELERIRAENPEAEPHEVMRLLNRYINLTMAPVNLYATGTCMMIDPTAGDLHWVNAGHPPAFLRRVDGAVTELKATSMLLGALEDADFDPAQSELPIRPGDVVIAYTDGAFEARDSQGRQFGLPRLRETAQFNPPPRNWTRFISTAVAKHHQGHADDDVLIASLTFRSMRVPGGAPATQVAIPASLAGRG